MFSVATITSLGFNIFSTYQGAGMREAQRDMAAAQAAAWRTNEAARAAAGGFTLLNTAAGQSGSQMNSAAAASNRLTTANNQLRQAMANLNNESRRADWSTHQRDLDAVQAALLRVNRANADLSRSFTTLNNDARRTDWNLMRRDLDTVSGSLTRMGRANNAISRAPLDAMKLGLLALKPAIVPIAASLGAVGAATVSMGVTAGTALGVYGLAMNGAVKSSMELRAKSADLKSELEQQKQKLATLKPGTAEYAAQLKVVQQAQEAYNKSLKAGTPSQQAFIKSVDAASASYKKFIAATQDKTLAVATLGMQALSNIFKQLTPIVNAVHPAVLKVATAFRDWTTEANGGFQRFVDVVIKHGVPALDHLFNAGRHVLTFLGEGFRAFAPFGVSVAEVIERGAKALADWATGGGFQRWIEYVREHGPTVQELFKTLWEILKGVIAVIIDLGPPALELALKLAKIVEAIPPAVLLGIVVGFVALGKIMKILVSPVRLLAAMFGGRAEGLGGALARMLPMLLKFAGLVGAVITVVALAWKHSEFFRDRVKQLWEAIQQLWQQHLQPLIVKLGELNAKLEPLWKLIGVVAGFILGIFVQALTAAITVLGVIVDWLTKLVSGIVFAIENFGLFTTYISTSFMDAVNIVWQFLQRLWDWITGFFATVWTAVRIAWDAAWAGISTAVQTVWTALQVAWNAVVLSFQTVWTTVSTALVTAWNAVWNGIQTAAQAVWTALQLAWNTFINTLQMVWTTVSTALVTAWTTVWNGLQTAAQVVWTALTTAWNAFINGLQTVWTTVSGALSAAWSTVWNALQTAAQAVWTALTTAWNAFINGLQTVWSTVSGALTAAWNTVWNALQTAAQAVWTALQTAWTAFVGALGTAWSAVSGALTTAWNTVWNALQTAAQTVWTALTTAWNAFINGLQTVWSTVSGALTSAWNTVWNGLQTAAQTVWTALQTAWNAVCQAFTTAWNAVSGALTTAWNTVWNALQTAATTVWNALQTAWNALWTAVRAAWDAFSSAFSTAWQTAWNAIKTAADTVWEALKAAWNATTNRVREIWDTFITSFRVAWQEAWDAIRNAANTIWEAIKGLWNATTNRIREIWDTFITSFREAWREAWDAIKNVANEIWEAIKAAWNATTNRVREIWDSFWNSFKSAWTDAWNSTKEIADRIWHEIGEIIEKAINAVITVVNGLIKGFNNITKALDISVSITEIKPVNFNFDQGGVVRFAYGGITGMPGFCKGGVMCPPGKPPNMSKGGALPGYAPGRDTVPAMLSKGEGVLVPEAVRGLGGPGFVHSANRTFAGHRGAGKGARFNRDSMHGGQFGQMEHAQHTFAKGGMVGGVQNFAMGGVTLAALARAGLAGTPITQPEFNPGVAASAGTHDGGGTIDLPANPSVLAKLLATGEWAAWMRGPSEGMTPHIHAVLMSHPQLSGAAKAQVASFKAGGTGLGVGGGGGGGIDVMGMLAPHIGKILLNMYRGIAPLTGIGGAVADFFSGAGSAGASKPDEPFAPASGRTSDGGVVGPGGVITGGASSTDPGRPAHRSEGVLSAITSTIGLAADFLPLAKGARVGVEVGKAAAKAGAKEAAGGAASGMLSMLAKWVLPAIKKEHITTGLSDAKKATDAFKDAGNIGKMIAGFSHKLIDDVIPDFILKKAAAAVPPPNPGVGGTKVGDPKAVQEWAGLAAEALKRAGLAPGQLGAFLALMAAESGGDPNARNNTDVNAKNGVPSQGLMQVIPPTFAAHRDTSLPNNILDPLANMTAAARYIKSRYGGNVPGSPYATGTTNATPGLHMVGEQGPELVMGPGFANFGGGETVLNAMDTQSALSGIGGGTIGGGENTALAESFQNQSFEDIQKSAEVMAAAVDTAWTGIVDTTAGAASNMTPLLADVTADFGVNAPEALEAMRLANETTWQNMAEVSTTQWALMRDVTLLEFETHLGLTVPAAALAMQTAHDLAWVTMGITSLAQWILMRDIQYLEFETHLGVTVPAAALAMQVAHDLAWTTMNATSTAQWILIRDTNFIPFEEHMSVTMVAAATTMSEAIIAAFTAMSEAIVSTLDTGIAKMDEFIAKAQEAIAITGELVAAVAEAQAAMAALAAMPAMGAGGAAGGTAAGGVSGNVESWRALAAEAIAAGGLAPDQLDAFLQLMQAESGGDPNAINNWDINAQNGTPSIGLMQVIQPTFDAHNVTGGNINDPFANMAASAAYIKSRYGGIVPGSPYARGTASATAGMHLVGEEGPELVGLNGPGMAMFSGGQSVLAANETSAWLAQSVTLVAALTETMTSIDAFIAKANEGIAQAKAMTASALAAAAARAAAAAAGPMMGGGNGSCALPAGATVVQGPYSNSVAASAGTHSGGGVYDLAQTDGGTLSQLIANGFAAWIRGNGDGMSPHIHAVCMNAPDLSPQAAWQVGNFQAGGSGLGIPSGLKSGTRSASRGWHLVGERGPEMWRARGGEQMNSWKKTRELLTSGRRRDDDRSGMGSVHFSDGAFQFNFNGGVTSEALNRIERDLVPKLKMAVQAGCGKRSRP